MKHLKKDVVRLAATYLTIIMVMSVGFSIVFYTTSLHEFDRRPRSAAPLPERDGDIEAFFDERTASARQSLSAQLLSINVITFIIGGLLSYLLAERSLRPIEDNMEAQLRFVSDASHELRTPLTALATANEVALRNPKLTLKEAKKVIAENIEDVVRLQHLTNSMLGLLKEEDADQYRHHVELVRAVDDAVTTVVNQALEKGIAIINEIPQVIVRGNHQALVQLLTIFLDNAIKYSPNASTVWLTSTQRGRNLTITVRDEGMGMSAETQRHLFTRFYRADESRSQTTGYGLGLSIAKKLVQAHGGKLSVTSEVGRGSAFHVTLALLKA